MKKIKKAWSQIIVPLVWLALIGLICYNLFLQALFNEASK